MALSPPPPDRAAWLALRNRSVGSSEQATLWGVEADYAPSLFKLWHIKAGLASDTFAGNRLTKWGLLLEEVIATAVAEEKGWTVRKGRYAVADDTPGMAATLDFEIDRDPTGQHLGPGILETKNVQWLIARRYWTEEEPPPHIILQLQHQFACTGYSWGAIGALVGGNELRILPFTADPDIIASSKQRVTDFWRSIAENRPPPADGGAGVPEVLRQMYPEVGDPAIDLSGDNEFSTQIDELIEASAARKAAEKRYHAASNALMAKLGPHRRGFTRDGFSASIVVVKERPTRPARIGDMIPGRAESRSVRVQSASGIL